MIMAHNKNITIQDIAERASVSISTVSRVLNDTAPVAEETRQKVLSIIAELGYKPNLFAQGLAGGQSRTIGVLTQLIGSPFYDVILRGILKGIEGSTYSPIFADGGWDIQKDLNALNTFIRRKVDGLIILDGHVPDDVLVEVAGGIPMIVIGRSIPALKQQCIPFDDFDAAYKATQYLIESGHRRIAHITGLPNHEDAIERREGYLQALQDAGLEPDQGLIVEGDFTEPSGVMAVEMLLMRGHIFSAIFAANDQMAYGARLALYRRGLRVPEDVSIVGFDDQAPTAYMVPPLTTIRRPPLEIGEAAGKALIDLMQDKPIEIPKFQSTLMIRESVIRR
jgi:LacI family transcriptional regulator